jgi:Tfp pilus assembly protein PilV
MPARPARSVELTQSTAPGGRRIRGASALEALAALVVIAAGVIGIAALYADSAQTNVDAQHHTRAIALANEIAARIEHNPAGRVGYAGTVGVVCKPDAEFDLPQDAAANEAACWEDRVAAQLPNGFGSIRRDTTTTPVSYVVSVSWSAPARGAASYVVRVTPKS